MKNILYLEGRVFGITDVLLVWMYQATIVLFVWMYQVTTNWDSDCIDFSESDNIL